MIVFITLGIGFSFFGTHKPVMANQETVQESAAVQKGNITLTVTGSGAIESSSVKQVASEVTATVNQVLISVGDEVQKGDVLFVLDDSELESQIRSSQKAISNSQKKIQENQEQIENLTVYAEKNGYVSNLRVGVGDTVNQGTVLFDLIDDSYYQMTADFHYNKNNPIQVGDIVHMLMNGTYESIEGQVTNVSDFKQHYDYGGEIQEVEIQVKNPGYTLEGITASQITVQTQSGGSLMALSNCTFEMLPTQSVKAKTSGTVSELYIHNGDYLSADMVVMKLENDALYDSLTEEQSSLSEAYADLADRKEDKAFYTITAPIDGVVTELNVSEGDYVRAQSNLAKLVNHTKVQFDINVDELDILDLAIGQEVQVTVDALDETARHPLVGTVTEIALEGTNMNSVTSYPVTISLDGNEDIRIGMNCTAEIEVNSAKDVLVIPVEAVESRRGQYFVTMEDGTQREIEVGLYDETNIEVVRGLEEGEMVKLPAKVVATDNAESESRNGNAMGGFMGNMPMGGGMQGGMQGGGMPTGRMNGGGMNGGR